jgi:hypothetical protein
VRAHVRTSTVGSVLDGETCNGYVQVCHSGNPVAFADHNGFQTEFGHEMDSIARIEQLLEQGQYFVHMLYTFRSVSRAIPMVRCRLLCLYVSFIGRWWVCRSPTPAHRTRTR